MLKQKVQQLPRTAPEYGICHGDFMSGNTLLDSSGRLVIIDLDFAGYGWRLFDLATFVWIQGQGEHSAHRDVQQALLEGYHHSFHSRRCAFLIADCLQLFQPCLYKPNKRIKRITR